MVIQLDDEIVSGLSTKDTLLGIAIFLYQQGKVSLGKAAQIAGLHRFAFQGELEQRGIDFTYQTDDLLREACNLALPIL